MQRRRPCLVQGRRCRRNLVTLTASAFLRYFADSAPPMQPSIRPATAADAPALCGIYNHYVATTAISFETEPVSEESMVARIAEVQAKFPWLVYEEEGQVLGYAYATQWKPRAVLIWSRLTYGRPWVLNLRTKSAAVISMIGRWMPT